MNESDLSMSLPEPFAPRVARLRAALAKECFDGALVSWPPHVSYLSGIDATSASVFLLVDAAAVTAVVPEGAEVEAMAGVLVATYASAGTDDRQRALEAVAKVLQSRGLLLPRIGIERGDLRLADLSALSDLRPAPDVGPLLAWQRMRKDEAEIDQIRSNLRVLAAGFDAARAAIRPGVSELAVWSAMHAAMMATVGSPFALEGNFASGPRTLEDEPQASNRCLEDGDMVYIDLYPIIDGYAADLTRCFVVGQPTQDQLARHAVLEAALAAGVAALKPGVRASDVDGAVRASVAASLGGYAFPHHAGHALGMQGQERPLLIPGDETVIEPGMVIAIEPGAYLPDTGGMRVEGNYLVTETGAQSLSDYPLELFACS